MALKKQEASQGAPEWVVTYGDCMSLLLCFFISLVAMSEIKKDKFQQALESIQRAFGGFEGNAGILPIPNAPANVLLEKLLEIEVPVFTNKKGDSDDEGIEGRKFRVTNVRDGLQVVVGGRITFDRFSATLLPEARDLVRKTAERIQGYNSRILVRGHATNEPLPADSLYRDGRDLSYARALAVADELRSHGVRDSRLILVAAGDHEPLVKQAYTEERRALNRRVEILITENLVDEYSGSPVNRELPESRDGG